MTKPDFIIIGAMKSATSTLHTQLSLQPGIFMSTPKEPNYFSDDEQYARGEAWYRGLFADANKGDLCGESSTHYTKLPDYPHTVERMAAYLEQPKLIYVMRHPVDRLVSHYIHQWTQNVIKCDINEAIDRYDELIAYSRYVMQLQPYFEQFGCENVLPVFMEAIKVQPQQQLERVARFIGYSGQVQWQDSVAPQNVSRERIRTFWGYRWLIESRLMTEFRRSLIPRSIRNRVKQSLTMQQRPEIDAEHLSRLNRIFDEELAVLGQWLKMDLTCADYLEKVTQPCEHLYFSTKGNTR